MNLDWRDDWRWQYFPGARPSRLPKGYRSHARLAWDAEMAAEAAREVQWAEEVRRHAAQVRGQEEIERWRDVVEQFGWRAVERIVGRTCPGFRVPAALRPTDADKEGQ